MRGHLSLRRELVQCFKPIQVTVFRVQGTASQIMATQCSSRLMSLTLGFKFSSVSGGNPL